MCRAISWYRGMLCHCWTALTFPIIYPLNVQCCWHKINFGSVPTTKQLLIYIKKQPKWLKKDYFVLNLNDPLCLASTWSIQSVTQGCIVKVSLLHFHVSVEESVPMHEYVQYSASQYTWIHAPWWLVWAWVWACIPIAHEEQPEGS